MKHCKTEAPCDHCHPRTQAGQAFIPALLVMLTITACAAAVWQWQRSGLHSALAQAAETQLLMPVNLNSDSVTMAQASFARVQGQWLQGSTTYIAPRLVDGKMGALAVSVLLYTDPLGKANYLAVQRGWAAQTQPTQAPALAALSTDTVALEGALVDALPKAYELQAIQPTALGLWQNHDLTQHGVLLGKPLESKILVLSTTSPDAEAKQLRRIPAQQAIDTLTQKVASNRGYAAQWLGLALVGLLGLGWMWRSQSKQNT